MAYEIGFPALEVTLCVVCSEETCANPLGAYHAANTQTNAFLVFPVVRDIHVAPEDFPALVRSMLGDRAAAALAQHGDEAGTCATCGGLSPPGRSVCRPCAVAPGFHQWVGRGAKCGSTGCTRLARSSHGGLCRWHRKNGAGASRALCGAAGCKRVAFRGGGCRTHYRSHGAAA